MKRLVVVVAALAVAACSQEEGPLMSPGEDCLSCHSGGEAPTWTVAGTWPPQGRHVTVVDKNGKTVTLHANQVGNFWSSEPFVFPLQSVNVDGAFMPPASGKPGAEAYAQGSCNRCHGEGGGGD